MKFIDYSQEVYSILQKKEFGDFNFDNQRDFLSVLFSLKKDISLETYQNYYKEEVEKIIDHELPIHADDKSFLNLLKNNYFYTNSAPKYSTLYLFWIWNNNIHIEYDKLEQLIKAIFIGTVGHRFVDMFADSEEDTQEFIFLSNYLIRKFENTFINVLGIEKTYPIFYKYAQKFSQIE